VALLLFLGTTPCFASVGAWYVARGLVVPVSGIVRRRGSFHESLRVSRPYAFVAALLCVPVAGPAAPHDFPRVGRPGWHARARGLCLSADGVQCCRRKTN